MAMREEWLVDGHLNLGQSIVQSSSAALQGGTQKGDQIAEEKWRKGCDFGKN